MKMSGKIKTTLKIYPMLF